MVRQAAAVSRRFDGELSMKAGKRTDDREPFASAELPVPGRDCMLFPEQVRRFRDDFRRLVEFAAEVCGVKPEELCPLHLLQWRLSQPPLVDTAPIVVPGPEGARNSGDS